MTDQVKCGSRERRCLPSVGANIGGQSLPARSRHATHGHCGPRLGPLVVRGKTIEEENFGVTMRCVKVESKLPSPSHNPSDNVFPFRPSKTLFRSDATAVPQKVNVDNPTSPRVYGESNDQVDFTECASTKCLPRIGDTHMKSRW